jgi:hypothetical protein
MNIVSKYIIHFCSSIWLVCCEKLLGILMCHQTSRFNSSTAFPTAQSDTDATELQSISGVILLYTYMLIYGTNYGLHLIITKDKHGEKSANCVSRSSFVAYC